MANNVESKKPNGPMSLEGHDYEQSTSWMQTKTCTDTHKQERNKAHDERAEKTESGENQLTI